MPRFIETIKLLDGELYNVTYHQNRVDRTIQAFNFSAFRLETLIQNMDIPQKGLYKFRIVYGDISPVVEITKYVQKIIQTLRLVEGNDIDYQFKYEDRDHLHKLYGQRKNADDIIVVKKGMITDSYFANLIFKLDNYWVTPEKPLLKGTQRDFLIDEGLIKPMPIKVNDLAKFEKVKLINSMVGFSSQEIEIDKVIS